MKKILFSLMALVASMSMNAQIMKVMKGNTVVATYTPDQADNVIFIEAPDYVEIGGKKWATMNLGATTVSGSLETCAGDFYQYGSLNTLYESISWSGAAPTITWKAGKESGFVVANLEYTGKPYQNRSFPVANDVVRQTIGKGWRMPTQSDFIALYNACTGGVVALSQLTSSDLTGGVYGIAADQTILPEYTGVAGVLFVDKEDPSKRLFFPCCGYFDGAKLNLNGYGNYWTSIFYDTYNGVGRPRYMWVQPTSSSGANYTVVCFRNYGLSVRPVKD